MYPLSSAMPAISSKPASAPQFSGLLSCGSGFPSSDFSGFGSDFQKSERRFKWFFRGVVGLILAVAIGGGVVAVDSQINTDVGTPIETVQKTGLTSFKITDKNYVVNNLGLKLGHFDEDGHAYDMSKNMVGYVDDNGIIHVRKQQETSDGDTIETMVEVGTVDHQGTVTGYSPYGPLSSGTLSVPLTDGLNWKEAGAAAILGAFN